MPNKDLSIIGGMLLVALGVYLSVAEAEGNFEQIYTLLIAIIGCLLILVSYAVEPD